MSQQDHQITEVIVRESFHRRQRMLQRWEGMTPEEREKFRHGLHARFCCHGADKD